MFQNTEIHQCNALYIQSLKEKNYMIISLDAEKSFDKIQHPFMIEVLEISEIQGTYLNVVKAIHNKPTANVKLNEEILKAIPLEPDKAAQSPCIYSVY